DSYASRGDGYQYADQITIDSITGDNGNVIVPRAVKSRQEQKQRSRKKAEIFTPSWVCNFQNNVVDAAWFGREGVFNTEVDNPDGSHSWIVNTDRVVFPEGKTWRDYVNENRMEITCGEAPYLVSRYDTVTGEPIPLERRIGLLDRKLRVVNENTSTPEEWLKWVQIAFQSTYGYEWQGDNILLARESLLYTFIDCYRARFGKDPQIKSMLYIAEIVSWNIWQMDALKCVIPNSCHETRTVVYDLFGESETIIPCEGCRTGKMHDHNGVYCLIKDWKVDEILPYVSLIRKDFSIGQ
ncbi:MAG: restriction endonuclease subunit M, partial [Muribaculaceae bacterium]|nr:restriction endonuclease subunit M [Muribaculaceae bacterium]